MTDELKKKRIKLRESVYHLNGVIEEVESELEFENPDSTDLIKKGKLIGIGIKSIEEKLHDYHMICLEREKLDSYKDVKLDVQAVKQRWNDLLEEEK